MRTFLRTVTLRLPLVVDMDLSSLRTAASVAMPARM